jgi:hypothetical protein
MASVGEPAATAPDRVPMQVGLPGDARVGASACGLQDDLRAYPRPVLGLVAVGHRFQSLALGRTQGDRTGGGNRQGRQDGQEKRIKDRP